MNIAFTYNPEMTYGFERDIAKLLVFVVVKSLTGRDYDGFTGVNAERIDAVITDGSLVVKVLPKPSPALSPSLGIGESDSIRLAMERPDASLLILDDRLARRYALPCIPPR